MNFNTIKLLKHLNKYNLYYNNKNSEKSAKDL